MSLSGFETLGPWSEIGNELAGALATDTLGRVLVQLRDDFEGISMPGHWGLFGGHVEPGEALIDTVVREFAEETGLDYPQNSFVPFVRLNSSNGHRHFIYRLTAPVALDRISLGEGAGFAFINENQLDRFQFLPAARHVLEHYFKTLGHRR